MHKHNDDRTAESIGKRKNQTRLWRKATRHITFLSRTPLKNKQSGFTLVELIVATAMVGIMVIGITNLFIAIDTTQRRTQRLEAATRAGEQQVESLRNAHYNSLEPGTSLDFTAELPTELAEPRTAIVDITEPSEGIRRLDVRITYRDGSVDREVNLSTVIGNIGIGQ